MLVGGLTVGEGSALPEEQWGGKEGTSCPPTPTTVGLEHQCGGKAGPTVPRALLWTWAVSTCLGLAAHEGPIRAGCFVVRTPHAALPCPPWSRAVPL